MLQSSIDLVSLAHVIYAGVSILLQDHCLAQIARRVNFPSWYHVCIINERNQASRTMLENPRIPQAFLHRLNPRLERIGETSCSPQTTQILYLYGRSSFDPVDTQSTSRLDNDERIFGKPTTRNESQSPYRDRRQMLVQSLPFIPALGR